MQLAFGLYGRKIIAAAAVMATGILSFSAPATAQTKVALVIGNGGYRNVPEIPNPPNDAADVAAAFLRLGFSVRLLTDATYSDMRRALLEFTPKARDAEMAVVFFAGHGIELGGENWLIPVDAELKTDLDTAQEAISLRAVMLTVSAASKLGLVVLDACRNNPFVGKIKRSVATRSVGRGLSRVEPTSNVLVAYAARDGTTAADGDGRNSPFTIALLKHLETPGLEINFLFRNVRDDVIAATGREQEPFIYGSLSKEAIYLNPPRATLVPTAADQAAWSLLKETTDEVALKRFTAQYPDSALRKDAEARIAALAAAGPAKSAPPGADEVTWLLLKETSDQMALQRFTVEYPNSPRRQDAEARIAALAKAPQAKAGPAFDETAWNMVKDTKDPDLLRRFIERFPNSAERAKAEQRIASLSAEASRTATPNPPDPHELARSLQLELKRVGCFNDSVNGEFDDATKAAWRRFTKLTSISLPLELSSDAIKAVRGTNERVCPLVCPRGSHAEGDVCVANERPPKRVAREAPRHHREPERRAAPRRLAPLAPAPSAPADAGDVCAVNGGHAC